MTLRRQLLMTVAWLFAGGACTITPTNGSTDSTTNVVGHSVTYAGFDDAPGTSVTIQVVADPEHDDPNLQSSWVNVATAVTSTAPFTWNDTDPLYFWSVTADPVPSLAEAARWPQGGVQRVRALINGRMTTIFDEDFGSCLNRHPGESWKNIGIECASATASATPGGVANVANIVSTSPNPADQYPLAAGRKHLLSKKQCLIGGNAAGLDNTCSPLTDPAGTITQNDTRNYYAAIGAPATLNCFKTNFGLGGNGNVFDCGFAQNSFTNDLTDAVYYNNGDLGIGRHMRCRSFVGQNFFGNHRGVACYVSNYSTVANVAQFGTDPEQAIHLAVTDLRAGNENQAFATVAMVYQEPITAPNSVKFMVYDAAGQLATQAQLDNGGFNKAVPTNCLVCHGGTGTFNAATSEVRNAQFLPFDASSFIYSSTLLEADATRQIPNFRALNNLVLVTNPPAAEADLINNWYGYNLASGTPNFDYIPAGFNPPPGATGSGTAQRVYTEVVRPYCRTCHISQLADPIPDFATISNPAKAATIKTEVCDLKLMPQAEHTLRNMWASPARAHLIGGLNLITSCKP